MNPFKRSGVRYGSAPVLETPYQRAGQAWDDRIGSARVQAQSWRLMAFASWALSAGLAGALVWQGARGSITPWVVEVDRTGAVQAVGPAAPAYTPQDPQIAWHLARFIEQVRSIPADPVVLRRDWLQAFDYVTDRGGRALSDYARGSDPFATVGQVQVSVDVSSVIRASPSSFRVAWIERRYVDGVLTSTERWTAILGVVIQPPRTAEQLRRNPLGIFVHSLDWSKELN